MDAVDDEQSVDLWMAVREIVNKYMWDQMQMHDHAQILKNVDLSGPGDTDMSPVPAKHYGGA